MILYHGSYCEVREPDSPRAIGTVISLLMPERLTDQLCFRTRGALDTLKFLGSEKIWQK